MPCHTPPAIGIEVLTLTSHQAKDAAQAEHDSWLNDKPRARKLRRKMDLRILPLCAWMYLLNYLDRGNIGNSKLLNSETGDSLIEQTSMTNLEYAIAVSLFAVAYALFEVPSNWIMKRYVRPSRWLATLLLLWGVFTIGFAGVQNFAQVTVLRFFIGMFEAGFFPGMRCDLDCRSIKLIRYRYHLSDHFLVSG
jgi:sugar phosphate permease